MATLIQCDICGDIIPPNIQRHELVVDRFMRDMCPKCSEALRLWMISQFRGAEPERGEEDEDG